MERSDPVKPRILMVTEQRGDFAPLRKRLRDVGFATTSVASGLSALREMNRRPYDLVLTGLHVGRVDGIELLERIREMDSEVEVIIVTTSPQVRGAVEAMRKGAYDYLGLDSHADEIVAVVSRAMERCRWRRQTKKEKRRVETPGDAPPIITGNDTIRRLLNTVRQIAPTDCNVLITGETGTGKELIARRIHAESRRSGRPFVAMNCSAFSEDLLDNELFGHEKEAFTGASSKRKGFLEAASGGTIFLDEIGEMPPPMQVKLLRVLQEKRLRRVGGIKEIPVDIRVLAATNRNLAGDVKKGHFRRDLYYRLNVIHLHVPPLAERREDIPILAQYFLERFSRAQGKEVNEFSPEALEVLHQYEFPGNVRELENIVERAVALCRGPLIDVAHLPSDLQQLTLRVPREPHRRFQTLEEYEREYILWVLKKVKGNKTKAARILGIDRVSLWRRLKRFDGRKG